MENNFDLIEDLLVHLSGINPPPLDENSKDFLIGALTLYSEFLVRCNQDSDARRMVYILYDPSMIQAIRPLTSRKL